MASKGIVALTGFVAGTCGVIAGLVAAPLLWPARAERVEASPTRVASPDPALARSLHEIAQTLRALDARLATTAPLPPTVSDRTEVSHASSEALERALTELEVVTANLRASNGWGSAEAATRRALLEAPADDSRLQNLVHSSPEALSRDHLLWTKRDVLAAYGKPNWVRRFGDGIQWGYAFSARTTYFHFVGDEVLHVSTE